MMNSLKDSKTKANSRKRPRNTACHEETTACGSNSGVTQLSSLVELFDTYTMTSTNSEDQVNKLGNTEINYGENPLLLGELEEEIERQLEAKARKNNLSVTNVKNMIKAVITSEEVLNLLDFNLNMTQERPSYEPKLTRAKIKELFSKECAPIAWPLLSPSRKSDIAELINQELPDDSSDEEYHPQDEESDEESKLDESLVDDEIVAPPNNHFQNEQPKQLSHNISLDENIGQRTRSKFSLSETPLETIEQAFIPPDITAGMYNTDIDNKDWLDFLKEFTQPLSKTDQPEIEENDPEYNVMVDEEHEGTDKEEMRMDRAVKVSKKELNELMNELYEYTQKLTSDDDDNLYNRANKIFIKDCDDNTTNVLGHFNDTISAPLDISTEEFDGNKYALFTNSVLYSPPQIPIVYVTEIDEGPFLNDQKMLFEQQLRQHIQLSLTNFLLCHGHPVLHEKYAESFKSMLLFWESLSEKIINNENFLYQLMEHSIQLMKTWERVINNPVLYEKIKNFLLNEMETVKNYKKRKLLYKPQLPPILMKVCQESLAILYPLMLPSNGFLHDPSGSNVISMSEAQLIAIGMEEYGLYCDKDFTVSNGLSKLVNYLCECKLSVWPTTSIYNFIRRSLASKQANPIKYFSENRKSPEIPHFVIPLPDKLIRLKDQPKVLLPEKWNAYMKRVIKR